MAWLLLHVSTMQENKPPTLVNLENVCRVGEIRYNAQADPVTYLKMVDGATVEVVEPYSQVEAAIIASQRGGG